MARRTACTIAIVPDRSDGGRDGGSSDAAQRALQNLQQRGGNNAARKPPTNGGATPDAQRSADIVASGSRRPPRRCAACHGAGGVPGSQASSPPESCTALADACFYLRQAVKAQAGDVAQRIVQELQAEGHRPSLQVWTLLIAAFGAARKPQAAERVLLRMANQGCPPDGVAYAAAVSAWCSCSRPSDALRLVDAQRARGVPLEPGMFYDLLACLAQAGRSTQAEKLIARMEEWGVPVREGHFNALVRGYVARRDLVAGAAVIEKMFNDAQNMELVASRRFTLLPSAVTYGLLLDAYCNAGDVASAQALLSQMRWRRVPPNAVIFNMMITAFSRAGRPDAAEAVLREMLGSGSWDMEALGVVPTAITFAAAADGWAALGRPDKVKNLFARAATCDVALDEVCFGILIKAYARARRPGDAEDVLLRSMPASGIAPSLVCWSSAVSAWCTAGQPDAGEALLRRIPELTGGRLAPSLVTWNHIIYAHAAAGDVAAAAGALQRMVSGDPDAGLLPLPPGDSTRRAWDDGFRDSGLDPELISKAWTRVVVRSAPTEVASNGSVAAATRHDHVDDETPAVVDDWRRVWLDKVQAGKRLDASTARLGSTRRAQNTLVKKFLSDNAVVRGSREQQRRSPPGGPVEARARRPGIVRSTSRLGHRTAMTLSLLIM